MALQQIADRVCIFCLDREIGNRPAKLARSKSQRSAAPLMMAEVRAVWAQSGRSTEA